MSEPNRHDAILADAIADLCIGDECDYASLADLEHTIATRIAAYRDELTSPLLAEIEQLKGPLTERDELWRVAIDAESERADKSEERAEKAELLVYGLRAGRDISDGQRDDAERRLWKEQLAHERISSMLNAVGVETPDGTSTAQVEVACKEIRELRATLNEAIELLGQSLPYQEDDGELYLDVLKFLAAHRAEPKA